MDVKVIGAGCPDCDKLKASTEAALKELGINAEIQRITALKDIVLLGVMTAPSLLVDGNQRSGGKQRRSKEAAGEAAVGGSLCGTSLKSSCWVCSG